MKITFSEDVYNGSPTAIPADNALKTTAPLAVVSDVVQGLTVTASEEGGGADLFGTGEIVIAGIAHQVSGGTIPIYDTATSAVTSVDDDSEDLKVFYVTFQVPLTFFGGQDGDTAALPIDVWVNVDENAVYTRTALNAQGETVYGEGNEESDRKKFTIKSALEAIPVTATPSATTVDGSTDIVVTLSATVTIPSLMASDFTVMEGDDELTPVWDGTAKTLTITPMGTGDTTVTVDPSTDGAEKISFTQVSVMVDRTAPMVDISQPTQAAMAGDEVTVTVSVDGDAGSTAIDLSEISVTQDVSGTAKCSRTRL